MESLYKQRDLSGHLMDMELHKKVARWHLRYNLYPLKSHGGYFIMVHNMLHFIGDIFKHFLY